MLFYLSEKRIIWQPKTKLDRVIECANGISSRAQQHQHLAYRQAVEHQKKGRYERKKRLFELIGSVRVLCTLYMYGELKQSARLLVYTLGPL